MSLVPKSHSRLPLTEPLVRKPSGSKASDFKPAPSNMFKKLNKDDLKTVLSHTELAKTANGVRMLTRNLAMATIQLHVRAVMIVTKARDNSLIYLTREMVEWLLARPDDITVYVDNNLRKLRRFDAPAIVENHSKAERLLKFWKKDTAARHPENFDLVVTLGGDGTVLYVLNLFQRVVPPVMSFALGSLGFLTNFRFEQFRKRMTTVLDTGVKAYMRMRFTCRVHTGDGKLICEQQVLNELVVDRGPSPYVTNLELYGDGSLLTVAQADGLIIATPTGSTAYSLSAGGSLVHPGVSAISVTPICPHTLSFRPILLPDGMFLKVKIPTTSRATAWASFDGKVRTELKKGYYVTVRASPFPFPSVRSSKTEYFDSVSRNLNWNAREQQKPFSHFLTGTTKSAFELNYNGDDHVEQQMSQLDMEGFDIDYSDNSDTDASDRCLDHDEEICLDYDNVMPYVPLPGSGVSTPSHYGHVDNRTCYAHPNAVVLLFGDSSNSDETESDSVSRLEM